VITGGLRPALSSDAPATAWDDPINPWLGLAAAVGRATWAGSVLGTAEAISAAQAMHCYTANGAHALAREDSVGSIAAGKDADLIVLPADSLSHDDPAALVAVRPDVVLLRGRVVHGSLD